MLQKPSIYFCNELRKEITMPKMKTRRAAAKRFKIKPSGKVKRAQANKEHILTKKSRARKNRLKKGAYVNAASADHIKRCLPNG